MKAAAGLVVSRAVAGRACVRRAKDAKQIALSTQCRSGRVAFVSSMASGAGQPNSDSRFFAIGAVAACAAVGWGLAYQTAETKASDTLYTYDELQTMVQKEGRIVVAYQGALYDMTHFTGHPGGMGRLQMAAGGDLEVFWAVYTQHNRGHIAVDVMKPYKIGVISPEDMKLCTKNTYYDSSAYDDNSPPYPDLLTNTRYPYNAEARLSQLTDNWVTPVGRHFVRNHCAVPNIDPQEYRLTVTGIGLKETQFTLEDLKTKFPKVDITTVIQCNGNRREDYHYLDGETPAFGPPHWVAGAIGNSMWSGVRLRDLFRAAGMDVDNISLGNVEPPNEAKHVGLRGYDHDEVGNYYCCSFPFDKSIDPFGDVIIAYEMNGKPIPREHGFPARCVVPGHAGARNCKFIECVTVTSEPCGGDSNWKQYAVHAPDVHQRKIAEFEDYKYELKEDPPVQEMPVQSMITNPTAGEIISAIQNGDTEIYVKGFAWGGGGAGINRVDVSLDNGKHFTKAKVLAKPIPQRRKAEWSWVFFEKKIPIPEDLRRELKRGNAVDLVLVSKALNTAWNSQPECPESNFNAHGCCVNHWYRVPVSICPKALENNKPPDGDFANKPSGGKFRFPFRNEDSPDDPQVNLRKDLICDRCFDITASPRKKQTAKAD